MKTNEQVIKEIYDAMQVNKAARAKCNTALSDAISLVQHMGKETQDHLAEEHRRGMNDAWEIAKEVFDECNYCAILNVFGQDSTLADVIRNHDPIEVKRKILTFKEEQEKIHVGDVVKSNIKNEIATVISHDSGIDDSFWTVFTENGNVECWCQVDFIKIGNSVNVKDILIK